MTAHRKWLSAPAARTASAYADVVSTVRSGGLRNHGPKPQSQSRQQQNKIHRLVCTRGGALRSPVPAERLALLRPSGRHDKRRGDQHYFGGLAPESRTNHGHLKSSAT